MTNDIIELTLPINPAYVSAVRLTASSIANRLRFNAEEIEDIKTAVSESCTFLINMQKEKRNDTYTIRFIVLPGKLDVSLTAPSIELPADISGDFALNMVKALVDELSIGINNNEELEIVITKNLIN